MGSLFHEEITRMRANTVERLEELADRKKHGKEQLEKLANVPVRSSDHRREIEEVTTDYTEFMRTLADHEAKWKEVLNQIEKLEHSNASMTQEDRATLNRLLMLDS